MDMSLHPYQCMWIWYAFMLYLCSWFSLTALELRTEMNYYILRISGCNYLSAPWQYYWLTNFVPFATFLHSTLNARCCAGQMHYNDVMINTMASQITSLNRLCKAQIKENMKSPRHCPLCGEFAGHRWIPHTKASDTELWCFLWSSPE